MTTFDWKLYPLTEQFLLKTIADFLENNNAARQIAERMRLETATRFFDWVDHIALPAEHVEPEFLIEVGFTKNDKIVKEKNTNVYTHPASILFPILLTDSEEFIVALKPENLDHFLQMNHSHYTWPTSIKPIDHQARSIPDVYGEPYSPYRKALINKKGIFELWAVERRGFEGFKNPRNKYTDEIQMNLREFMTRRRMYNDDTEGLQGLIDNIKMFCKGTNSALVTDAFFRTERRYWQSRDRGGQVQKAHQDRLGLGWGNHDHHTYRSSRKNFHLLIKLFETMGFKSREQFFAGPKAGWGAQVLEHPVCGITIFADVDITNEEKSRDFAHESMKSKNKLGTVGMWVALHGESIFQAGMHHLAARVNFELARTLLKRNSVETLRPFSDFSFLKQSFTTSEKRLVEHIRLKRAVANGQLTTERSNQFRNEGAISSHLEIIQRSEGFKGFNQDSVSVIIKSTDPRKQIERNA